LNICAVLDSDLTTETTNNELMLSPKHIIIGCGSSFIFYNSAEAMKTRAPEVLQNKNAPERMPQYAYAF